MEATQSQFKDMAGCAKDPAILALLDTQKGEKIIFSCFVLKFNRWGMSQQRTMLVTNKNLYNLKKAEMQRRIAINQIKAVTKSTKAGNLQFIVHINSEYDYMFDSEYRKEIFEALKWIYYQENKMNLPVFGVPDKLKDFATSKKDIYNGVEVNPKDEYRLKEEDIYKDVPKSQQSAASTTGSTADDSEIDSWNNEVKNSVAKPMFIKNNDDQHVTLNDFIIKSVIGRGSFGKVFLVQKASDKKVYAMKSLRKDVIIDYD